MLPKAADRDALVLGAVAVLRLPLPAGLVGPRGRGEAETKPSSGDVEMTSTKRTKAGFPQSRGPGMAPAFVQRGRGQEKQGR